MSDVFYNIWGVVTGTLGLLGLLRLAWIYTQLPSRKLCAVERLLEDTETTFTKGLDDGLHTCSAELFRFHSTILSSKLLLDDLRGRVRELKTSRAELRAWWGGLSAKIASLHEAVEELHGEIIEGGSRDRRRLAAEGYANALAKHSGARSQERRSTILSLMGQDDFALSSASGCGPAGETPRPDEEWYPSPRRTDSPPPIPENDAPYHAQSNSRARAHASLHAGGGHAVITDAGALELSPNPVSSFVSDADLKHLLALALAPSRCRYEKGRRHRALRRDVLLRLGKHLLGADASYDNRSEASSHTQHAKRARLKAGTLRMRGTQGPPSQGMGEAASSADVNEASVVVEKGDECDAMEWQDE